MPAELDSNILGLDMLRGELRSKMMEKLDEQTKGVFPIDPTP